jgi:hypothetical protein
MISKQHIICHIKICTLHDDDIHIKNITQKSILHHFFDTILNRKNILLNISYIQKQDYSNIISCN